jgi:predicted dehydrogenase
MLLPHLVKHPSAVLASVATTRSLSAVNAQQKFGFQAATTDADVVLDDPSIDAVFVVTRHHSHADFACKALERGKAVFVEKPLALTAEQVDRLIETVARTGNDRLMVGFNRRFAPLFTFLQRGFGSLEAPVSARYLVSAGRLDANSWYRNEGLEGSRFLGEGGHFLDTLSAFVGHHPTAVHAVQTPDGEALQVSVTFTDGSLGTITYTTSGGARFPKETFDVSGGGRSARLDNFTSATVWTGKGKDVKRSLVGQDKGQRAETAAFLDAVRSGSPMPIALDSLIATTRATIATDTSLLTGRSVSL